MKNKTTLVQIVILVLLAGFLAFKILPQGIYSSRTMDEVAQQAMEGLDGNVYPQRENQTFRRVMGLEADTFEEARIYRTDDLMSAGELVLVKTDNPEALAQFEEAAKTRQANQAAVYEGYAPEQEAQVKAGQIDTEANWALYYVGDNPDKIISQFKAALKGGKA